MKQILLITLFSVSLWADGTALFAGVTGVSKNDTLSIRSKPSHKSKKVGSLPPEAYIAIEKCEDTGNSKWCRIYQIPQQFYEGFHIGWVNARYLNFSNRGYVNIIGEKNDCYVALECQNNLCSVVKDFDYNYETDTLSNLLVKEVRREKLEPTSNFGAMSEEGDGYCTSVKYIENHFKKQNLIRLSQPHANPPYQTVVALVEDLRGEINGSQLLRHVHPQKGLIMTWNVMFSGKEDMRFGYSDIKSIENNRNQKIYWGQTYGKGDDVWMSLYDYMKQLTRPIRDITRVNKLKDLKGFKRTQGIKQVGYEVFWINEKSDTKEYDYLGLLIILEMYEDKWYVVGMLRDRWTI